MPDTRVVAYRVGPVAMLWCTKCGPMGVTEGDVDVIMVREHLTDHCEESHD